MKVQDTDDYELVFSIKHHFKLGYTIEPIVIAYTSLGSLSLTHQKVFSGNASYYTKLTKQQLDWIKILDPLMPETIIKTFSKKQKIRPKEYFNKYFDQKVFTNHIRPFMDEKYAQLISKLPTAFKHLYLADEINPAMQRIELTSDFTKVLFHLRRSEKGTNYFVTLKHDNQRFAFMKQRGIMISTKPAILIVHKKLYRFYDFVDGSRLAIFLNKKFVHIPVHKEKHYYSSFVKKLMETSPVYAEGFTVNDEQHDAKLNLQLFEYSDNKYCLRPAFVYGKHEFWYNPKKHTHVHLEWIENEPIFTKIRRSKQWEENQVKALETLGIERKLNNIFTVGENSLQETMEWIRSNSQALNLVDINVRSALDKKYNLHKPKIAYNISEKQDWFDVDIQIEIDLFKIPFSEFITYIKKENNEFVLPDGSLFIIPEEWFALGNSLLQAKQNKGVFHVKKYQLGILEHVQSTKIKKHLNTLVKIKEEKPHAFFKGELRPYQLDGLSWLMFLYNNHFGGILADDMGLGKTVQTLAFLQHLVHNQNTDLFEETGPILLVAPTSLLYNWQSEAGQFTPELQTLIHSGQSRTKDLKKFKGVDIIITSYGLIRNDFELLNELEYSAIVLDESQNIKNRSAKTTQKIYKLNAKMRLALTGTPIENSISDLWSQMQFLNPLMLGSAKKFEELYVKPIEKEGDVETSKKLQRLTKPFILRRTKSEVAKDLPQLSEKIVLCEMTSEQQHLYDETKSAYRNSLLDLVEKQGIEKSKLNILQGLSKLRQLANHPKLIDEEFEGESGKHNVILEHISTAISEGHKILVFSQFVRYLNLLATGLEKRNMTHLLFTGSTTKEKRKVLVDQFQESKDPLVFLLSLKAGGTGLNLTAADYVFIVDPWWNPAAEAQARDRSHRIGQESHVFSYKFISKDTIEEKIVQLQKKKEGYSRDIIVSENNIIKNLDSSTLENLFF